MKPKVPMMKAPGIDTKEFELIKKMVALVSNFVISGDPNSPCNDFGFTSVTNDPFSCLDISNDSFKMIEMPEKERMDLWDEILQEANIPVC
jgi:hypothetical protein